MVENRIFVFDLDDTLVDTQAKVRVVDDNGNVLERLGTQFHNDHVYEGGTHLDYSEFEDLDVLLAERELPAMRCLEYCIEHHPDTTYILTARQRNDMIMEWLRHKGLGKMWFDNVQGINFGVYKTMPEAKAAYVMKWKDEALDIWTRNNTDEEPSLKDIPRVFLWEDNVRAIKSIREALEEEGLNKSFFLCNVSLETLKRFD